MKDLRILLLLLLVFAAGCAKEEPQSPKKPAGEYCLPLIETTDIHGHILSTDGDAVSYSLAYIADKANDIRGDDRSRLLLLDGGDLYQGAAISNLIGGRPVYISIDKMGYDAVAVGNHEFDWDFSTLADEDATLPDYEWNGQQCVNEVPVLCANLFRGGRRVSSTSDYVIVEKSASHPGGETVNVRIGIIGFAINYSHSIMESKFTGMGYSIREDYSIANDIAAGLESSGQCDATVLLIHGNAKTAAEKLGNDSVIDLVAGGHSHQTLSGIADSGVPFLQGGRYGEHYGYSELVFKLDHPGDEPHFEYVANQRIMDVSGDLSGRNKSDFDQNIIAVSDYAVSAAAQQLKDVVGYIGIGATTYNISGSGGRASTMSNWMCDILRRIGDADVAFVNRGGIRTTFPMEGKSRRDITVSDIYEMFPFNNATYVYRITYEDLLRLFEFSLTESGESLFSCMTGIDCRFNGQDVVSLEKDGLTIYENGRWNGDWKSRTLTLAASEFLATSASVDYRTRLANPLIEWNGTSRLLSDSQVDNENAVRVLREESALSGGRLYIDNKAHFLPY